MDDIEDTDFYRPFGRTGLIVPRLVFGATTLGNLFVAPSDETKRSLVRSWFDQLRKPIVIDTAGKYGAGLSLEVIARELGAAEIDPSDVIISNKLAWRRVPLSAAEPTFEPGVWIDLKHDAVQDISYDGILRCYEDGKRILGKYGQQLVSVHDPDEYLDAAVDEDDRRRRMNDLIGAYRALTELRDSGEAVGVGVGSKTWTTVRDLSQHCDFDWVMLANSFTIMRHPPELLEFVASLREREIALINSALTHGGFLVGSDFCDYRKLDPSNPADRELFRWRDRFEAACQELSMTPYDLAVAFGAAHPAVTSVALSSSRPERTAQMISAVRQTVEPGVWSFLNAQELITWTPSMP